jgi:hypothetical protein
MDLSRTVWLAVLVAALLAAPPRRACAVELPLLQKHRIVVMTDIGGDPDDRQSLVRFLLYACEYDVEGLCTGFGHGHYKNTRPDLIHDAVDAYGKVLPRLVKHRADYPSHEQLSGLVKDGHNGDPHKVGPGMDSEASEWIIKVLDRDDPRPVWFSIWGGPRELAQAIWKVQMTRSPADLAAMKRKIRVHSIADQDRTAGWVKEHHPDVFWIYSKDLFRGIWKDGDPSLVSPAWLAEHVRNGHGPLGPLYPANAAGKKGVKEGDTPSFFYLLPDGLSDPEHPEWGNWGGRFRRSGRGNEYLPAEDRMNGRRDMLYTVHRWRRAYQNAFEARMDWCVKPFAEANHEPVAVLNGDRTRQVIEIEAEPDRSVKLSADGSTDPDGDALFYEWWVYGEAGSHWSDVPLSNEDGPEIRMALTGDTAGREIHVVLEVTDGGSPRLTAYRRVVVKVGGDPVPAPPGTPLAERDLTTPVTKLSGPPGETGPWRFWRGVNINGKAVEIDGKRWEGDGAEHFTCRDKPLVNVKVRLLPPADPARERMIRSFRWGRKAEVGISGVPAGIYAIYAYIWEETSSETLRIRLNGKVVERDYNTGRAGEWRRLGPWITDVTAGRIALTADGGAANLSGIEIWRK